MKTFDWIAEKQETCVDKPAKEELKQQYVDSYKEPPLLFTVLIAFGTIFGGIACIFAIYGIIWFILSHVGK
jgi:hypothetical protein